MTYKEERSEYVGIYVSPSVKKEIEAACTNKELQETIIKNFLTSEKLWLKQEISEIDEATVKYQAKLIGIKDSFKEKHLVYIDQIEDIYSSAKSTFDRLDSITESLNTKSIEAFKNINEVSKRIGHIDVDRLERLLNVISKYKSLRDDEKELIKALIEK